MKINPGVVEHCLVDTSKWERNTTGANGARGGRVLRFRARRRVRFGVGRRAVIQVGEAQSTQSEIVLPVRVELVAVSASVVDLRGVIRESMRGAEVMSNPQSTGDVHEVRPAVASSRTSFLREAIQRMSARIRRYSSTLGLSASNHALESVNDGPRMWS
jgi:hypothetical protein